MLITADMLDDLLAKVFQNIRKKGRPLKATRGCTRELLGVMLHLKNPRARISRTEIKGTIYSGLGELLWYLAGSDALQFICYYASRYKENSADGSTIHGAYGPRLWRMRNSVDQIGNVLDLLRKNPTSRRAVIQLFNAEDLTQRFTEIPCTCTLQFLVRDKRLHLLTNMRSNDAFVGLPHDVFAFTMLQEIFATTLGVGLGSYRHVVGSMHLYDDDLNAVESYLAEGWHEKFSMPPMPNENPWSSLRSLLRAEGDLREGRDLEVTAFQLAPYWADLMRLLQIYRYFKNTQRPDVDETAEFAKIDAIKKTMSSRIYDPYIEKKKKRAKPEETPPAGQLLLPWK